MTLTLEEDLQEAYRECAAYEEFLQRHPDDEEVKELLVDTKREIRDILTNVDICVIYKDS